MSHSVRELLQPEVTILDWRAKAGPLRLRIVGPERLAGALAERLRGEASARAPAGSAEVTVLLIDAERGLSSETRRRVILAALLGAERVVAIAADMDRVAFAETAFRDIEAGYRGLAEALKLAHAPCIPACVADGDNVVEPSPKMTWYAGPTLSAALAGLDAGAVPARERPLRLLVETARSPGVLGTVVSGELRPGDAVRVQPPGRSCRVVKVESAGAALEAAGPGTPVQVDFAESVEVAPGAVIASADRPAQIADQFEATIAWTGQAPLFRGRSYQLAIGAQSAGATIAPLKYKINVDSLEHVAAAKLDAGEIGVCGLQLDRPIAFDPYRDCPETGGFVLVDALSDSVVGAGMLHFALRRAQNVHWQAIDVNKAARSSIKGQKPCVLWYTGLSGAGKSTIANLVDQKLHAMNRHTYLLDGDNVRHGLNKDLGFTAADRVENIRRIAEVAKLMVDAGLIVGTAFISPFRAERQMARALLPAGEFIEIFVDTPLDVAERRDPKGLYKKARRGELKNFTGIDSPYEPPENPELRIDTTHTSPEAAAEAIVEFLAARGALGGR